MDVSLVLGDFFSRSRIPPIILHLSSSSLWSSFRWLTILKFSGGPALNMGPFQKAQHEVI